MRACCGSVGFHRRYFSGGLRRGGRMLRGQGLGWGLGFGGLGGCGGEGGTGDEEEEEGGRYIA